MSGYGATCPRCKRGRLCRRQRKSWMRLIPYSKQFECDNCDARLLSIFGGIMKLPLTHLKEAQSVSQTDLTSSIQSPMKERARWLGKFCKLYLVTTGLVILALSSFIIYQGFGGKAVQEISRRFLYFLPKGSTPQDGLIISEPKNLPKGELVTNRTNLPEPEEKKAAPSVLPEERKPSSANILAEAEPSPEKESLANAPQSSQIDIKRGESLARIVAQHYPENEQIGLVAIILANPEIYKDDLIYFRQVLKLPKVNSIDKTIQLQDNLFYILYGRYYSDVDLKMHTLWLNKKKIRFIVRNTKDSKGRNVHRVILGGYETKEELEKAMQSIKTKSR
jgi:hypothetical protein